MKDQVERIVANLQKAGNITGIENEVGYLSLYWGKFVIFHCKESAARHPYSDFVIKIKDKDHYVRFKALCRLLGMPINQKIIASFLFQEKTLMVLGGWMAESTLNRDIVRFLAKATMDRDFESIQDFADNHHFNFNLTFAEQERFLKFFSNLPKNLPLNQELKVVNELGIIFYCKSGSLKFEEKTV